MKEREKLIAFRKRGLLSKKKFDEFLELARMIAVFDPNTKKWFLSWDKIRNISKEHLEDVLNKLSQYTDLTPSTINRILEEYSEKYIVGCSEVEIDSKLVVRSCGERLKSVLYEDKLNTFFERRGGYLLVKSILYLPAVKEKLGELGIKVYFDEKMITVVLRRIQGRLYASFYRIDKPLYSLLSKIGTLYYNEERVKLGPSKEYMGTELVRRKIRVFEVDWRRGLFITSMGLIGRLEDTLRGLGFKLIRDIEELPPINVPMKKRFELFPHQEEALTLWLRRRRGTIAIFTRGGKSFIALGAIYELKLPTLILVPTRELILTWMKYLQDYLGIPKAFIGRMGGGEKLIRPITVSTYNSAVKYIKDLTGRFELAIFDEAHHVPASTFKEVALNIDSLYRMALSATPKRRDGNENLLYSLCGELIYTLTYGDLLRLKMVAPIEVFDALFVESEEEKLDTLLKILKNHRDAKTIIFTQRLDTAKRVYDYLRQNGFRVEIITGETPTVKREIAFKRFLDGRSNIIVSTTVLDEGITVPDAEVAIIYEGTGEARQMIQRIGRVLGYHPGKTAKIYEIINVNDPREKNAYRRRSWIRELYLVEGLEKYVKYVKEGREEEIRPTFQRRIDTF